MTRINCPGRELEGLGIVGPHFNSPYHAVRRGRCIEYTPAVLKGGHSSCWKKTEEGFVCNFIRELFVNESFVLHP
jgi:hypothetical protein